MEHSSLSDFITYLQYGTKLHIGVQFLGDYGNEKCRLPFEKTIHASRICDEFKGREGGIERCFRCRNVAFNMAKRKKRAFAGVCVNGVYEYTRPVIIDGNVVCIIYVGNILDEAKGRKILIKKLGDKKQMADTLEKDFGYEKCERVGELIETYICMLLDSIPAKKNQNFDPLIENIKIYIKTNLEYDIKLSTVARFFNYNEQYLGRLFKKAIGISFNQYICKKRIDRALKLLKETDDSVINIALAVGFNNVTYFNRVFKRCFGITPLEYRKNN